MQIPKPRFETMNTQLNTLTRREALFQTFKGAAAVALTAPVIAEAESKAPIQLSEPEFVPDNDYPFFGGDLPEGY